MEGLLATRFPGLAAPLLRELTAAVAGHVYDRVQGAQGFAQQTRLWNGNLICPSKAVACPVDAHDVSRCVRAVGADGTLRLMRPPAQDRAILQQTRPLVLR
jgi:hypothetical protein